MFETVSLAQAQGINTPLILDDPQTSYSVGLNIEYLEDPTGDLTIDDVSQPEFAARFVPNREQNPNFGFTDSAYWIRLHVSNETNQIGDWRLAFADARMGLIDLYYQPQGEVSWTHQQAGRFLPATVREYLHPYFVFPLAIPPSTEGRIYLRIQANVPIRFSLTLWPAELFAGTEHGFFLILGVVYGIMIVMSIYNLMIFFFLKKISYLYYFLFISMLAFNVGTIDGVAYVYLFPNWIHTYTNYFTAAMLSILGILFIRSFLELRNRIPWLDRTLIFLAILFGLFIPTFFFNIGPLERFVEQGIAYIPILVAFLAITAALITWRQGLLTARYFLLGWLGYLSNIVFRHLSVGGALPSSPVYDWSLYLSIVLMVIFLSLALAYQIEVLRVQTAQSERAMRASERRFTHLYENAPVGIAIADPAGNLEQANQAYQALLGYSETELRSLHYLELLHPDEREPTKQNFQELNRDIRTSYEGEVQYLRRGASPVWVKRSVSALRAENGEIQHTFAMAIDISKQKKYEAELRSYTEDLEKIIAERTHDLEASRAKLSLLNRSSQTINMAGLDSEQVYVAIRAACAWLVAADVVTISIVDHEIGEVEDVYLTDRDQRLCGNHYPLQGSFIGDVLEGGVSCRVDEFQAESKGDQQANWFSYFSDTRSGMAVLLRGSKEYLGVMTVQSYSPNAYAEGDQSILESFASHVSIALENIRHYKQLEKSAVIEERQRLASELHDSTTQLLYSMALMSSSWGLKASQDQLSNPAEHFYQLEELSLQALKEMRMLVHHLRPPVLEEVGLLKALEDRLEKVERRVKIDARLNVEGVFPRLLPVQEEELYYISLEALNNSLRHGHASSVQINFRTQTNQLHMSIVDNGRGYDLSQATKGMGTSILDFRAAAIGARLKRDSQPGQGTRIELEVEV